MKELNLVYFYAEIEVARRTPAGVPVTYCLREGGGQGPCNTLEGPQYPYHIVEQRRKQQSWSVPATSSRSGVILRIGFATCMRRRTPTSATTSGPPNVVNGGGFLQIVPNGRLPEESGR